VGGALQSMSALLTEDQTILRELQTGPFAAEGKSLLQSYLAEIRAQGVVKGAPMKQRLDLLAENNTALVTLISLYASQAKTPAFAPAANKFRSYAAAWRDRWNSVMELLMAGGDYPPVDVPFPAGFPAAVDAEISATRGR
jgi:hypothetical protein